LWRPAGLAGLSRKCLVVGLKELKVNDLKELNGSAKDVFMEAI
jgi:hypothetical protein